MSRICFRSSMVTMLTLLISSAVAQATVFTDAAAFDAANPGLPVVIDFEGIAPAGNLGVLPDFSAQGVTFTNLAGTTMGLAVASGSIIGPSSSDFLITVADDPTVVMHFDPDATAAGFNFGISQDGISGIEATVEAFNGTSLLESVTLTTTGPSDFTTFIGFSGLGNITEIKVTAATPPSGSEDTTYIDNVIFGVPEPASLSLLAVGVIFGVRRRRGTR